MQKQGVVWVIGIILLIGAAFAYVILKPSSGSDVVENTANSQVDESTETEASQSEDTEDTSVAGQYVAYDEQAFIDGDTQTRLLFFHASWCPQCQALDESIETDGVPDGVIIYKVDYDSSQDLRQAYGVTLQTTVVRVDADGNKVAAFVAYDDPTISAVDEALLDD